MNISIMEYNSCRMIIGMSCDTRATYKHIIIISLKETCYSRNSKPVRFAYFLAIVTGVARVSHDIHRIMLQLLYSIIEIFVRPSRDNHGTFARRSYEVHVDVVLFPVSQLTQIRGN